jgi:hypothetical protein
MVCCDNNGMALEIKEELLTWQPPESQTRHRLMTATMVPVFLLAHSVSADAWNESERGGQ